MTSRCRIQIFINRFSLRKIIEGLGPLSSLSYNQIADTSIYSTIIVKKQFIKVERQVIVNEQVTIFQFPFLALDLAQDAAIFLYVFDYSFPTTGPSVEWLWPCWQRLWLR